MKRKQSLIIPVLGVLLLAACKEEYFPEVNELDKVILVVEGYIDGANETVISLSRLSGMGQPSPDDKYVQDATVHIEDNQGRTYPLFYSHNGNYRGTYVLDPGLQYRIRIHTQDHNEYESAMVPYKVSPPIESLTYRKEPGGALFMVNTRDNTGGSKYYRWKYHETWQFRSFYLTSFQYDPRIRDITDLTDSIYDCWQSQYSTEILLNNSANLKDDIMHDIPLLFILNGSEKLSYIYSVKVQQYVMDSTGYAFYRQLKKNTEETGSIFDPQPGSLRGNIVNIKDPREIVVGYIGAGSSAVRRQFFQIPWDYRPDCLQLVNVPKIKDSLAYYFSGGGYWPILDDMTAWVGAPVLCTDCRTRGTNIKPDFWP